MCPHLPTTAKSKGDTEEKTLGVADAQRRARIRSLANSSLALACTSIAYYQALLLHVWNDFRYVTRGIGRRSD